MSLSVRLLCGYLKGQCCPSSQGSRCKWRERFRWTFVQGWEWTGTSVPGLPADPRRLPVRPGAARRPPACPSSRSPPPEEQNEQSTAQTRGPPGCMHRQRLSRFTAKVAESPPVSCNSSTPPDEQMSRALHIHQGWIARHRPSRFRLD